MLLLQWFADARQYCQGFGSQGLTPIMANECDFHYFDCSGECRGPQWRSELLHHCAVSEASTTLTLTQTLTWTKLALKLGLRPSSLRSLGDLENRHCEAYDFCQGQVQYLPPVLVCHLSICYSKAHKTILNAMCNQLFCLIFRNISTKLYSRHTVSSMDGRNYDRIRYRQYNINSD